MLIIGVSRPDEHTMAMVGAGDPLFQYFVHVQNPIETMILNLKENG